MMPAMTPTMTMDTATADTVVIGAGVVGLAIARALALQGHEVIMLEAAGAIGTGTSSRNSEVIHAGIYYPAGTLKARLCVIGRQQLYAYCADRGITARRLGKLIVAATPAQADRLAGIKTRAEANGVHDLHWLSGREACALEPALAVQAALLSPSTGIVDSHALMLALQGDAEAAGTAIAFNAPLLGGACEDGGFTLTVGGAAPMRLRCHRLVNAAGLHAWDVARRLAGYPITQIPPRRLAKGSYFALSGCRAPFSRLIYPVPEDGGLGVHLTLDMAGQGRFGPDVEWLDDATDPATLDYQVSPARGDVFYAAIRRYWPGLPDGALVPAYAGVRPKVGGPGEEGDFVAAGPRRHGIPRLVHLFGIESPGLTASLALGDLVAEQLAASSSSQGHR